MRPSQPSLMTGWRRLRRKPLPTRQRSKLHPLPSHSMTKMLSATPLVTTTSMLCLIQRPTTPPSVLSRVDLVHVPRSSPPSRLRNIWTTIQIFRDSSVTEVKLPFSRLRNTGKPLVTRIRPWLPLSKKATSHTSALNKERDLMFLATVQVLFLLVQKFVQTANNPSPLLMR